MISFDWAHESSHSTVSRRFITYVDKKHKATMEVTIPKRSGKNGRPKVRYYLEEDPVEYRSEEELSKAVESTGSK